MEKAKITDWLLDFSRKNGLELQKFFRVHNLLDAEDDALVNDLDDYPHAYVLACLMDRQIKAEKAWAIPGKIKKLNGGDFSLSGLLSHKEDWYLQQFEIHKLHRFKNMAVIFYNALLKIRGDYGGDASKIWSDNPSSSTAMLRFLQFQGAGVKIASMAINILARQYGVKFADLHFIDISPDVHVKRVFYRFGLVGIKDGKIDTDEVVIKARELNPAYPGVFDNACWYLGREFCRPNNPKCHICPAKEHCPSALKKEGAEE